MKFTIGVLVGVILTFCISAGVSRDSMQSPPGKEPLKVQPCCSTLRFDVAHSLDALDNEVWAVRSKVDGFIKHFHECTCKKEQP